MTRAETERDAPLALQEIRRWSEDRSGPEHADGYLAFLYEGMLAIPATPELNKSVPGRPGL